MEVAFNHFQLPYHSLLAAEMVVSLHRNFYHNHWYLYTYGHKKHHKNSIYLSSDCQHL